MALVIVQIQDADFSDLPETIKGISEATIVSLREKFPDGLAHVNIEVKSCAGTMFERYELAPGPQHALQAFVQAKATNRPTRLLPSSSSMTSLSDLLARAAISGILTLPNFERL